MTPARAGAELGNDIGMIARVDRVVRAQGHLAIAEVANLDAPVTLAQFSLAFWGQDEWHKVRLERAGENIRVWFDGKLVREFALDPSSARGSVDWDGRSTAGDEVPEGAYRVLVLAQDAAGDAVKADALRPVTVDAVRYDIAPLLEAVKQRCICPTQAPATAFIVGINSHSRLVL